MEADLATLLYDLTKRARERDLLITLEYSPSADVDNDGGGWLLLIGDMAYHGDIDEVAQYIREELARA